MNFCPAHVYNIYHTVYKLAAPRKAFLCPPFSQYNTRHLRQKAVGACLYMPQDGHWLVSFAVIPPPQKLVFPRPKNNPH